MIYLAYTIVKLTLSEPRNEDLNRKRGRKKR
jgi:hypothetical protein